MELNNFFTITNHAIERFRERFKKEYRKVKDFDFDFIKIEIQDLLKNSSEDKTFLNDSNRMEKLYMKYGYDSRFFFFVNGKFVFVCREKMHKRFAVVTVY